MMKIAAPPGRYRAGALLAIAGMLSACFPDNSRTELQAVPLAEPGVTIVSLSTQPWLVTGGDVLLRLDLEPGVRIDQVQVLANDEDVTRRFRADERGQFMGLISGLHEGENLIEARIAERPHAAQLEISNYPISGPIISGPHQQPFVCQAEQFRTVTGQLLGEALNPDCFIETREDYVYFSAQEQRFKPYRTSFSGARPADLAQLENADGQLIPFIVRVQTGTVNRAIYEIAMLHDPAGPAPTPWQRSANWNQKLVYTHGGGCRGGWHQQGDRTGGVLNWRLLSMGYALASASLNVFGQNCNDLLASETHIMVKERFVESFGEPLYTVATGASGGSYQSQQTADNYPGVFDGIIVSASFPDVTSATLFTLADSRLLYNYFTALAPGEFDTAQQLAITGFAEWESLPNLSRGAARLDPLFRYDRAPEQQGGEVNVAQLETQRYHPSIPEGIRATVYDHTINVYGRDEESGFAARPLDNTGVQYGLRALNEGGISAEQFIALNRDIGGFDADARHVPLRHRAHPAATRNAVGSGRVLFGGAGLATTPMIDYRRYTDDLEGGDIHMIVHQYSTRARLQAANGHADNQVMVIGGRWGFSEEQPDLRVLFEQMDSWLMGIGSDDAGTDALSRLIKHRPQDLSDACWDNTGNERKLLRETLSADAQGRCAQLYPVYSTPRHVAGAPLANDIVACSLKPVDPADYQVTLTDAQLASLQDIFADGVCDWSAPDRYAEGYFGTWRSFGPSPVNRVQ